MTLADYPMCHHPEMTEDVFVATLRLSPAGNEAQEMYRILVRQGLSPAVFLGFFWVESKYGTVGVAADYNTKNPGNVRTPEDSALGTQTPEVPGKGRYAWYPVWVNGTLDWCLRIKGPKYAGSGLSTVRQVLPKYAPAHDRNDPDAYARTVLAMVERWGGKKMVARPRITVSHTPHKFGGYAGTRRQAAIVDHITGGSNSLGWLRDAHPDPATGRETSPSSNYLIKQDGEIVEIVPPTRAAWANGVVRKPNTANPLIAEMVRTETNPNQWTISIEHEAPSGAKMSAAQWKATTALQAWLCQEFGIAPDPNHILGHFEIDSVDRPYCPGWTGDQWDKLQADIAKMLQGGSVSREPIVPDKPDGYLAQGEADTFNWQGAGVVVYRKVRYYNPQEGAYYEREWSNDRGFSPWEKVA